MNQIGMAGRQSSSGVGIFKKKKKKSWNFTSIPETFISPKQPDGLTTVDLGSQEAGLAGVELWSLESCCLYFSLPYLQERSDLGPTPERTLMPPGTHHFKTCLVTLIMETVTHL